MVDIIDIVDGDTSWGDDMRANLLTLRDGVNAAYVKPINGIGGSDLTATVVGSLSKADTATQPSQLNAAITAALLAPLAATNSALFFKVAARG